MKTARACEQQPQTFPVLPARMQRSDVERILPTIRHAFGISAERCEALITMIGLTKPAAWVDPAQDAICYMRQITVAAKLGKTARALRADEHALESLGFIEKLVAGDGSRGYFDDGAVIQGISFAPLIARIPELFAIAEARNAAISYQKGIQRQCSAARRIFKREFTVLLERAPNAPLTHELLTFYAELPRRYDSLTTEALEDLLASVEKALQKISEFFNFCAKTSGVPETNFRPLQDTINDNSVTCNASSVSKKPACKQAETNCEDEGTASAAPKSLEQKYEAPSIDHKPKITESFKPRQIYAACGEDFRCYLDAIKQDRSLPNELDFIKAAIMILSALGINHSAWDEAVEIMGDLKAAICVMVIEANRTHPVRPIHSPGGALRAFSRRAASGDLNLAGSLIGLIERQKE